MKNAVIERGTSSEISVTEELNCSNSGGEGRDGADYEEGHRQAEQSTSENGGGYHLAHRARGVIFRTAIAHFRKQNHGEQR